MSATTLIGGVEVDAGDVLRLVLQFLSESGLHDSLRALQDEAGVALNVVAAPAALAADVLAGRWDSVLRAIGPLKLPPTLLVALYEQVVRELIELRELDTARQLLRGTLPLALLRQEDPARHARLEALVNRGAYGDPAALYGEADVAGAGGAESARDQRRAALLRELLEHTTTAPPSRLLGLLGQAIKWQQHTGLLPPGQRPDLLQQQEQPGAAGAGNSAQAAKGSDEQAVRQPAGVVIKFGAAAKPEAAIYTPDGACLVTGSVDGIIEVYDAGTGRLSAHLPYQARDDFMLHDAAVGALAASRDSELLASGSADGTLKVWRLATGECLRKFVKAHGGGDGDGGPASASSSSSSSSFSAGAGVTCVSFSRDASQVLSGGQDGAARVFGLRSGKCLKELRGHASALSACAWLADGLHVATASLDGSVRVWDARTSDCVRVVRAPQSVHTADAPVLALLPLPRNAEQFVVVSRGPTAHLMTTGGALVRAFARRGAGVPGTGSCDFSCAALSFSGRLLYLACEDRSLLACNVATGALELESLCRAGAAAAGHAQGLLQAHAGSGGGRVTGLCHHPWRSELASYGDDGSLRVWQS